MPARDNSSRLILLVCNIADRRHTQLLELSFDECDELVPGEALVIWDNDELHASVATRGHLCLVAQTTQLVRLNKMVS